MRLLADSLARLTRTRSSDVFKRSTKPAKVLSTGEGTFRVSYLIVSYKLEKLL